MDDIDMRMVHWIGAAVLCLFLQLCRAQDLKCNATWDGQRATYMVSPEIKGMTLDTYSWTASTVLATDAQPNNSTDEIVSTADILSATKCFKDISLTKHYMKDGALQDFTASCSLSCTIPSNQVQDEPSKTWTGVETGVAVGVVVLVLVLLSGLIYLVKRKVLSGCQTGEKMKVPNEEEGSSAFITV